MDKNTLSNYGWIVIAVLVLAVMIALATPFGKYIESGVRSTTAGLFDTSEKAMSVVGMSAGEGNFEDGYKVPNGEEIESNEQTKAYVTFNGYLSYECGHQIGYAHHEYCYIEESATLTWEELKIPENAYKYGYDASSIKDTEITGHPFNGCLNVTEIVVPDGIVSISDYGLSTYMDGNLSSITLPSSLQHIGEYAFSGYNSNSINFAGTMEEWNNIEKIGDWNGYTTQTITEIICSDGVITL